ncbi:MAG: hypothetical protein C4523_10395 [Myxococcales bacterium]|nr:MAG: hypothetical protein C4523_10395 [Myxococcales bacterium]
MREAAIRKQWALVWTLLSAMLIVLFGSACGSSSGDGGDACQPGETRCEGGASFSTCGNDGSYGPPSACPVNQVCTAGVCQGEIPTDGDADAEAECLPADSLCVGDMIQRCRPDGTWGAPGNCAPGMACREGRCTIVTDTICQPGQTRCAETELDAVEVCNDDGTAWTVSETCSGGKYCYEGECIDEGTQICDPLVERRCNSDGEVQICNADGTAWGDPEPCQGGYRCFEGNCIPEGDLVCEPATETRCTPEGEVQSCNEDGSDWLDPVPCPAGFACVGDRCESGACEPNVDFKCDADGRVQWCLPSGDGYGSPEACPPGQTCKPGEADGCGAAFLVCVPGSRVCAEGDPHKILECNDDGSAYKESYIPCPAGDTGSACVNGECLSLCQLAERQDSYIGCEYWPVVLPNVVDDAFKQGNESEYAVVISNTNPSLTASVTIEYTGGGMTPRNVTVQPGKDLTVRLPYKEKTCQAAGQESFACTYKDRNAFRLQSTIPVTVVQFNPITACVGACTSQSDFAYTNDASLLLPTHVLGEEHLVLTYRTGMPKGLLGGFQEVELLMPTYFTIVGTQDGTSVTVKAHAPTVAGQGVGALAAGRSATYTLNRGEVLQFGSSPDYALADDTTSFFEQPAVSPNFTWINYRFGPELSGSEVISDKPVAVYAGNECSFVPHFRWACDHLEQQMYPTKTWTTQYIAARMRPPLDAHPNIYKILALNDGTELTTKPNVIDQTPPFSNASCDKVLNRGDSCMIEATEDFIVLANTGHPILVGQFLVGQDYFTNESSDEGDPAYILVPPVEQYRSDYVFLVPSTYNSDYLTILATNPDVEITLDDATLNTTFTRISNVNAYKMTMPIGDGTHTLTANGRVGLLVYGYDSYVSYAYPAGLDLSYVPF